MYSQPSCINMATNDDEHMSDAAEVELSHEAVVWVQQNQKELEAMVSGPKDRVYSLKDWEKFEQWGNNECEKKQEAWGQLNRLSKVVEKLNEEKLKMHREIRDLKKELEYYTATFSNVPEEYRTAMLAIEQLVRKVTDADDQTLPPPEDEEKIMDRLNKLIRRMDRLEQRRIAAHQEHQDFVHSSGYNPETSWLANEGTHCFMRFN